MAKELYRVGQKFKTYRDSVSGVFTSEITMHDQYYADEQGNWQKVVESFESDGADGFLVKANKMRHALRVSSVGGRRYYPRRNVTTEYLTLNRPQRYASNKWANLPFSSYELGTNSVTFKSKNYKFALSFNWNGINIEITLLNSSAPTQFRIPVALTGITLTNGRLIANSDGADLGELVPTWARDANDVDLPITESYSNGYLNFSVNTAGAVYPVVIDPDFAGDSSDGYIYSSPNDDFSVPRATSYSFTNSATTMNCGGYTMYAGVARYALYRTYIKFNTSSIPDTDIVTQVNLKLTHISQSFSVTSPTSFDVVIMKQDWSSLDLTNATDRETAWDGCLGGTQDDNIWKNTNGLSANTQYASGNLDTDYINVDGYTTYSLISSFDLNNVQPVRAGGTAIQYCYINIGNAGHATEAYRPVLTILHEAGGEQDELTSKNIATPAPTVDKSTIGQTHVLTSTDVSTPAPTVDKSTIAQIHALVSNAVTTPAPIVDKATLVEVPADTTDELVSKNIATPAPTVDKATIGQKHTLVSKNVATPAPTVDKATIAQVHALTSKDVATPAPVVDKATIGQIHVLVSKDVASGIPAVDKPAIGQTHALTSKDVTAGIPAVDKSTLGQVHALTSKDISAGVPAVDKPTIGQIHALVAVDITAGAPVVSKPTLSGIEVSTDSAAAALFYRRPRRKDDDEVLAMYALLENEW